MTPAHWREIEALFDRLADLSPAEREPVLAAQTLEIRLEVEDLLAQDCADDEVIREAIAEGESLLDITPQEPQRFGQYRVTGIIGQGGMGSVYRAVRDDGVYDKEVAIKVLHFGAETPASLERFRQERRILAALDHPNIARLIDGGETPAGFPYIVLEYIKGQEITRHCEESKLSREQRLRLFLQVCEAVEYAHRNLIVHRDLKPSNILVQADGTPRLLDFGIAKLVDTDGDRTYTQLQAMTPRYASPEQVRGTAISTATDVYSLGVVLYQLLTGRLPYDMPILTPLEIDRVVSEVAPDPPGLTADLDNIILKALRKEADRRYSSPRGLAEDIERFLNHEPVRATPDTWGYRSAKFVRRHWGAMVAGLALTVAICGGAASTYYQARLANERFMQVRKLARKVVFDIHDEIAKVDGTTKARHVVVRTALDYLDELSRGAANEVGLEEELAASYVKVGNALGYPGAPNLGQPKDALAAYMKAEALLENVARSVPAKRTDLGILYGRSARLMQLNGDHDGADERFRRALAIFEPIQPSGLSGSEAEPGYARILTSRASFLDEVKGDVAGAVELLFKASRITRAMLEQSRTRDAILLAQSVQASLNILSSLGRISEALSALGQQQALLLELLQTEPGNPSLRRQLAVNYQDLAVIYFDDFSPSFDDPERATIEAKKYFALARESSISDPSNNAAKFSLAIATSRVAASLRFSAPAEAVQMGRKAVGLIEELQKARPGFLNVSRLPRLRRILAEALLEARDPREAVRVANLAVEAQRELVATHDKDESLRFHLIATLYTAGRAYSAAGEPAAARERLEEAAAHLNREMAAKKNLLTHLNALRKIAEALALNARKVNDMTSAERWSAEAASVMNRYAGPDNEFVSRHRRGSTVRKD